MRTFRCSCCFLMTAFLLGCSVGPRTYKVSGTVTFDGKPLPEGEVLLVPEDKNLGPEPGKIKDGQFELRAREGKKRVEISASRIIPDSKVRGAGGEPVPEEYIPERFNTATILTAEVKADGENRFKFELEGKQGAPPK